jgi:myosin protein heavy chain
MAAKSSEDIKRQEAEKSREAEMTRLRAQVEQIQQELDIQRKKEQELVSKVREEVEGLRQRHQATDKELKAAKAEIHKRGDLMVKLQQEAHEAYDATRQVDAELDTVRTKLSTAEDKLRQVTRSRDVRVHTGFVVGD